MLIDYVRGQTSIILRLFIADSLTGEGKTGLAYNTAGLSIGTIADTEASTTNYTAGGSTIETITTCGTFAAPSSSKARFKELDSTNAPGIYEVQLANARYAVSSAKSLLVVVKGAAGARQCNALIPLRGVDLYNAGNAGLSYLDAQSSTLATAISAIPTTAPTIPTPMIVSPAGVIAQNVAIAAYPIPAMGASDGLPKRLAVSEQYRIDRITGATGNEESQTWVLTFDGEAQEFAYDVMAGNVQAALSGNPWNQSLTVEAIPDQALLSQGAEYRITWTSSAPPVSVAISNISLNNAYTLSAIQGYVAPVAGIDGSTFAASYSFGSSETTFAPAVSEIAAGLFSVAIPQAATNTAVGGLWKFTATGLQAVLVPFSTTQLEIHNSRPPVTTSNTVAATVVGTPACTVVGTPAATITNSTAVASAVWSASGRSLSTTPPTAAQVASAVMSSVVDTLTVQQVLKISLAVMAGESAVNDDGDAVTFYGYNSTAAAAVVTLGTAAGTRTEVTLTP